MDNINVLRSQTLALLDDTADHLNSMRIIPRTRGAADYVLLGLLSKLLRVGRAVVILSAAGLGDEAFGLCRTAVEIELAIRWLTNRETESRCRRFSDYAARNYVDLERKYCIHISREGTSSPATFKEMEAVAKEFKNQHRWWPDGDKEGGVKLFAAEPSTTELDDQGKPSIEEFRYDIIYRMMSYFTHGTIASLMANHRPEPEETFWVAKGAVSSRHEGNALRTAALSALLSLQRVLSYFNYEPPDLLLGRELDFQPEESS